MTEQKILFQKPTF